VILVPESEPSCAQLNPGFDKKIMIGFLLKRNVMIFFVTEAISSIQPKEKNVDSVVAQRFSVTKYIL
jgi:hypothetical protein